MSLESIIIEPEHTAQYSVIWLHGLGADGHDFEPIVPELQLGKEHPVRFIFPHAPVRAVTINNGMQMRAWYDILGFDLRAKEDKTGILNSCEMVKTLIENEISKNIAPQRIFLAGFSQGGAIALYTGLTLEQQLGGIIGLSTYLPLSDQITATFNQQNTNVPVFIAHGEHDPVVPVSAGQTTHQLIEKLGLQCEWHSYPMEHSVCLEEIQAISQWLKKHIKP